MPKSARIELRIEKEEKQQIAEDAKVSVQLPA